MNIKCVLLYFYLSEYFILILTKCKNKINAANYIKKVFFYILYNIIAQLNSNCSRKTKQILNLLNYLKITSTFSYSTIIAMQYLVSKLTHEICTNREFGIISVEYQ